MTVPKSEVCINSKAIAMSELQAILFELNEKQSYINVRLKLKNEVWQENFSRIVMFDGSGCILHNQKSGRFLKITDFLDIFQIEFDHEFRGYRAGFLYDII
jgi:hypothetical protein